MRSKKFYLCSFLSAALLLVYSCKKDVTPNIPKGPALGEASFLNLSEDLKAQVKQAVRASQYSYVLIDNPDTNYIMPDLNDPVYPYFYQGSLMEYPNSQYNNAQPQPWVNYEWFPTGDHQLVLTDTARHSLVSMPVTITPGLPVSVWYADNMGVYKGFVTKDTCSLGATETGLRVIDLSPDAGSVFFTINNLAATGFPDSLKYGAVTPFVRQTLSSDTLKFRWYSTLDSTTILTRGSLITQAGHTYTIVLTGYVQAESYTNPHSGSFVNASPDLTVLFFNNN